MMGRAGNMKNTLNGIIKIINDIKECRGDPCPCLPLYPVLMISDDNWVKFKVFSQALLTEWGNFTGPPHGGNIYSRSDIFSLGYKDSTMWKDTKKHHRGAIKSSYADTHQELEARWSPPDRPIINNSALLSKYPQFTGRHWKCPIPSIIDAQSVCNNLPIINRDEREVPGDGYPDAFNVSIEDRSGGGRNIHINIDKAAGPHGTFNYSLKFTFTNSGGQRFGVDFDLNYMNNKNILSAYSITELFINQKCIDGTQPDGRVPLEDVGTLGDLREIMGIFALKLMGDFSQELYAIVKNHFFVANDRVSAARYLLLKAHGSRSDDPARASTILNEPGGGGYLSYGGKMNNYFLLMGPVPPGGGGKKKKKTKRKSRKKVKRKSRKKTKRKKKT